MIKYSIAVRCTTPGTKRADVKESKAYAVAQVNEVMSLNDFARHIAEHGSTYSRADIVAVIIQMVDCMREMLLQGKKIQLGDLGAFHATVTSKGSTTASGFNSNFITGVNVKWTPGDLFKNLIENAEFEQVACREEQQKALNEDKRQETIIKVGLE